MERIIEAIAHEREELSEREERLCEQLNEVQAAQERLNQVEALVSGEHSGAPDKAPAPASPPQEPERAPVAGDDSPTNGDGPAPGQTRAAALQHNKDLCLNALREALPQVDRLSAGDIARAKGLSPSQTRHALQKLEAEGKVEHEGDSRWRRYWIVESKHPVSEGPSSRQGNGKPSIERAILSALELRALTRFELVQSIAFPEKQIEAALGLLIRERDVRSIKHEGKVKFTATP